MECHRFILKLYLRVLFFIHLLLMSETSGGAKEEEAEKKEKEKEKSKKTRPDVALRKKEDAENRFKSIRIRLKTILPSEEMLNMILKAVPVLSMASSAASKLLQCAVLEAVAHDIPFPTIDQTTIKHCIDIIGMSKDV